MRSISCDERGWAISVREIRSHPIAWRSMMRDQTTLRYDHVGVSFDDLQMVAMMKLQSQPMMQKVNLLFVLGTKKESAQRSTKK